MNKTPDLVEGRMRSFLDECDYLIHLVRCAIHNDAPSEIPDGAVFDSVYKYGVSHDVANIACYSVEKLKNKPDNKLMAKWKARQNVAVMRYMNQTFARDEILDGFREAGIRSVEVQGTRLMHLYPTPEYRTMSDIDFIIEPCNLGKAAEVLTDLGYDCKDNRGFEVDGLREPDIYVEVHTGFFSPDSDYYGRLGDPFENSDIPAGESVDVGREVLYLYSVMHIAKHYYFAGCGIRRILDLYFLNRSFADIKDSPAAKELFDDLGISDFVRDASEIAECWFGENEVQPDERLSEMIAVIKEVGVHGNLHRKLERTLEKDRETGKKNVKARYVLRRLFPEKWVLYEGYPVLKKCPVLMPFCWAHRLFKAITKNRRRFSDEIKDLRGAEIKNKDR